MINMNTSGQRPDINTPEYREAQQDARRVMAAQVELLSRVGQPIGQILNLVADHQQVAGDGNTCQWRWDATQQLHLSPGLRRLLIAFTASVATAGLWHPHDMIAAAEADFMHIPGSLVARMMVPEPYDGMDSAMAERLSITLLDKELHWLVCFTAGMFIGMDLPHDMVRALDPQWTKDAS